VDPLDFRISSAQVADETYVVTLTGELDLADTGSVDAELEFLAEEGARNLIVDLLGVPFLESTALGILLRHSRRLRTNGGSLTLVSDDVRVARVIEIAGLTSHFRVAPTLTTAIGEAVAEAYS
jgi:anti-sigma B factor antagonist